MTGAPRPAQPNPAVLPAQARHRPGDRRRGGRPGRRRTRRAAQPPAADEPCATTFALISQVIWNGPTVARQPRCKSCCPSWLARPESPVTAVPSRSFDTACPTPAWVGLSAVTTRSTTQHRGMAAASLAGDALSARGVCTVDWRRLGKQRRGVFRAVRPLSTSSTWLCGSLIASTRRDVELGVVKRLGQETGTAASDQVARAAEEQERTADAGHGRGNRPSTVPGGASAQDRPARHRGLCSGRRGGPGRAEVRCRCGVNHISPQGGNGWSLAVIAGLHSAAQLNASSRGAEGHGPKTPRQPPHMITQSDWRDRCQFRPRRRVRRGGR